MRTQHIAPTKELAVLAQFWGCSVARAGEWSIEGGERLVYQASQPPLTRSLPSQASPLSYIHCLYSAWISMKACRIHPFFPYHSHKPERPALPLARAYSCYPDKLVLFRVWKIRLQPTQHTQAVCGHLFSIVFSPCPKRPKSCNAVFVFLCLTRTCLLIHFCLARQKLQREECIISSFICQQWAAKWENGLLWMLKRQWRHARQLSKGPGLWFFFLKRKGKKNHPQSHHTQFALQLNMAIW